MKKKNIVEIAIHPDEVKALGEKLLYNLMQEFPDPMSTKDMFLSIETVKQLLVIMEAQLISAGVKLQYRREEHA